MKQILLSVNADNIIIGIAYREDNDYSIRNRAKFKDYYAEYALYDVDDDWSFEQINSEEQTTPEMIGAVLHEETL